MKRSIFIAVLGMGSLAVSYGQGYVNFNNYYSSSQTTGIIYGNGPSAGLGAGHEILVTLLYGATTDTLISQLTALSYSGSSGESPAIAGGQGGTTLPGVVQGAGPGVFNGGSVQVPGGTSFAFALEATGILNGQTYIGFSPIFIGTTATGTAPVPQLPAGLQQGTVDITTTVPEPTTLALAGLGGLASLVALRRKQA
jgi:hypothetical protein